MELARIAALLKPFLPTPLTAVQLQAISTYLELLLRWNARTNLTAVRDPEQIVTRHFGESLFAAAHLLRPASRLRVIDVGSGAGFPGLPLKIYASQLRLTLIESQQKKATFLKEAIRTVALQDVEVYAGRAETYPGRAELVTLRAVERFEAVLPIGASLLERVPARTDRFKPRLALLIGSAQQVAASQLLPAFSWDGPAAIPQSSSRILLVGSPAG
jgi:16S rRNA (guanine527-N7)-methyltransferase